MLPPTLDIEPHITIRAGDNETFHMNGLSLKKAINLHGRESIFQYRRRGMITLCDSLTGNTFSSITQSNANDEIYDNVLFIGDIRSRLDYYMEVIALAMRKKANVLMLLPDHYAAGSYFRRILSEKFGDRVLWYGSGTTVQSRMETFFRVRAQGGFLVLGNKSCVFLPMCRQSLIIVERQEEDEYRNEEGFKFNAGIIALKRASLGGIPVILGSASPSMEIYHHAKNNKFNIIEKKWLLDGPCQEKIVVPDVVSSTTFLEELIPVIKEGVRKGEKIAVFTPRKDYGSYLVCHHCKKPFLCPDCQGVLGYEKEAGRLVCSLCSNSFPYVEQCGHCGSNIIRFSRIGAEYVVEKLRDSFPDIGILKITGDSLKEQMRKFRKTRVRSPLVLVGTQSLSKLYDLHAQQLVLLGWEDLRKMGGYRSDEKMLQTLINLIDALTPERILFFMERKGRIDVGNYLDMERYYQEELRKRQEADFPPYRRAFLVEVKRRGRDAGDKTIKRIKDVLQEEGLGSSGSNTFLEKQTPHKWRIILRGDAEPLYKAFFRIYNLPEVQIEADPLYI